jgi:hypothetical protein
VKKIFISRLKRAFRNTLFDSVRDINLERQRLATTETANFVERNMAGVSSVRSWQEVHQAAAALAPKGGLVLEFGVFSGRSINFIASMFNDTEVHGFDSFEGLPEYWRDGFQVGVFATGGMPSVSSNVKLHKGWFDETIKQFLSGRPETEFISYLHVDCDLYSSTRQIFDDLAHLFVDGTVIVFDEYFNYPGWKEGEYKAFFEFIQKSGFTFQYITFNSRDEQVAVRLSGMKLGAIPSS